MLKRGQQRGECNLEASRTGFRVSDELNFTVYPAHIPTTWRTALRSVGCSKLPGIAAGAVAEWLREEQLVKALDPFHELALSIDVIRSLMTRFLLQLSREHRLFPSSRLLIHRDRPTTYAERMPSVEKMASAILPLAQLCKPPSMPHTMADCPPISAACRSKPSSLEASCREARDRNTYP